MQKLGLSMIAVASLLVVVAALFVAVFIATEYARMDPDLAQYNRQDRHEIYL